ncbi:hypothetical protein [Vibrio cidicii]|uniref:hypothetical protein n=1 Tax=Vibrio cidicii TaxID=1763883 RepID=UPI0007801B35|nr:hypothetical protein [Vibrio cidicii]KYN87476.1 hypothetical protein ATY36_03695 [Vibrio cidicii]
MISRKIFIVFSFFQFVSFGVSSTTLEQCTELLPEGQEYRVEIILDVDRISSQTIVSGDFSVTGGTDDSQKFDISEFVECAAPLIKSLKSALEY